MAKNSLELYTELAYDASWRLTKAYSTSFSAGIRLLDAELRPHISAIYGMVRVADEIVDSWADIDQSGELDRFEADCYRAMETGYSSNLILQSFALTYNRYHLDRQHVAAFFDSMRMDLDKREYDRETYERYIYGSAEVIGLMCLMVFVGGDKQRFDELSAGARALGSAFQKINFLRDLAADQADLGRLYFPDVKFDNFDETAKSKIVDEIEQEFAAAKLAIGELPASSRRGVALAWRYYWELLQKIRATPAADMAQRRIRVGDGRKVWLYVRATTRIWPIV